MKIDNSIKAHLKNILIVLCLIIPASHIQAQSSYYLFESGHVRPIVMSPDGSQLYAVNTPDNRLEIYDISNEGLVYNSSVPVGLEPVAVAARSNDEVWVVNHLSDSVSVVDVSGDHAFVSQTLLVGDEPRDIVFAGTNNGRVFISTAHRGQHLTDASISSVPGAGDPQLTTAGVGRADVWVFDVANLGVDSSVGGTPLFIATFFSDTPRALTVSPDGNTVYVAAFKSGNQTTSIPEERVCDGFQNSGGSNCGPGAPGGAIGPATNVHGDDSPETSIIVQFNGSQWLDAKNRDWSSVVNFTMPDKDVFAFNANATGLNNLNEVAYSGVGTILFNMTVNPVTGKLYVSNTESPNLTSFEGPGVFGGSTVQGRLSETRITVIDPVATTVSPKHLNNHIDYSKLHTANDPQIDADIVAMRPHTLSLPMQMVVSNDGATIYMAAKGSNKVGVFSASDIEDPSFASNFDPMTESVNYINVASGPTGLVLDEARSKLYVMQRIDHSIAEIDLSTSTVVAQHTINDPEPASVTVGRQFLYDGQISSGNGESSCASCHIFGGMDQLAWNLGNPDEEPGVNNQNGKIGELINAQLLQFAVMDVSESLPFHPVKGPMATQTLKGMANNGGMHWRGDRVDGVLGTDPCTDATGSKCDEELSFNNFLPAFEGLLGKDGTITPAEMQQFTDFALQMILPPNPVANLDNSLTTTQASAQQHYMNDASVDIEFFTGGPVFGFDPNDFLSITCNNCHSLDPSNGFFGTGGDESFEGLKQNMKIPHLRNLYDKVGSYGNGDRIRGFGFLHDGSMPSIAEFLQAPIFGVLTNTEIEELEEFILAFPSDLAPIVGQQVTLTSSNALVANPRVDLLQSRAQTSFTSNILGGITTECDLVVKGVVSGQPRGWLMQPAGFYLDDTGAIITQNSLRALALDSDLTYTCAVPGSGYRMALDRDEDTVTDGNDNCNAVANQDQANYDNDTQGDACDVDDDNDSLSDEEETALGTNTLDEDSDDDGFNDGVEVAQGSDPLDALSTPEMITIPFPFWSAFILFVGIGWISYRVLEK